ncbi:putative GST-like protein [Dichotomopilus funicola]|uniref:GST-like protein n=1 Tax=Dichotomopilus funicola TaxID=1934379 RepID=A0AAN6VB26_9PEZI|nr:putative GST-like protein [Dichotomopilus funicola]
MTYHLHITNKNYSSWSLRPWLLLRELDIPFVEEYHEMVSGTFAQPQWRAFSPTARVPCLHVVPKSQNTQENKEKEEPLILWDSLAITEYLSETHPHKPIYPFHAPARAWARSAVAEMHSSFGAIRSQLGFNLNIRIRLGPEAFSPDSEAGRALVADLKRIDELWTEGLRRFGGPFLAGGEFGAVDAFYAPVVLRLGTYVFGEGVDGILGEEAKGYVEFMVGGEVKGLVEWVNAARGETAREVVHERECLEGRGKEVVEVLGVTA